MINKIAAQDWVKDKAQAKLRITVKGGGCSGYEYSFSLDDKATEEDDILLEKDNAKLVVDQESLKYLKGSTVDYKESMIRSSFTISNNPNSEQSCSCGSSFSSKIKD